MNLLIALALLAAQEGQPNKRDPDRPTACEIRAYYLDKDGHPAADAKDVKASVVFESPDGKTRSYPMTWTLPKEDEKVPGCRHYRIEGMDYRFAVCATYSDASVPGGTTHYDKPWLRDLPVPIESEKERDPEKKADPLMNHGYFRTYLSKHEIDDIADGPYTDVAVMFTVRGDNRKTKCFSCREGVAVAPAVRVSDDLKVLQKQVEAGNWDQAKTTMTLVKEHVDGLQACPVDTKAKDDCVATCKDLESAVKAEKKDKALKEIHKLQSRCEACDVNPSEPKNEKK